MSPSQLPTPRTWARPFLGWLAVGLFALGALTTLVTLVTPSVAFREVGVFWFVVLSCSGILVIGGFNALVWWAWKPSLDRRPRPASRGRITGIVILLVVISPPLAFAWSLALVALLNAIAMWKTGS